MMNEAIRQLEPKALWNHFTDLNAVPRASKKEERVREFMTSFGKSLQLETSVDEVGNVLIRKPATPGMEDRKTVVLQSHLDMVHQKNSDTDFDFETQGIEMVVDGDWVSAKGTTLGADNGLGVAAIMSVLKSDSLDHPAIEALFTIDEETGMTGAKGLKGGLLKGEILLNLDTEEDNEIGVGCAGGIDVTATGSYTEESTQPSSTRFKITVKGLQGGHSGMDIHKGYGNANKLMNRLLHPINNVIGIHSIHGGSLRNAIPRESVVQVVVKDSEVAVFKARFEEAAAKVRQEYHYLEPDLELLVEPMEALPETHMARKDQDLLINALQAAHNGVFRMSPAIADLVETSNNIAKVTIARGDVKIECLSRSSVESSKWEMVHTLQAVFHLAGYDVSCSGDYPGWAPNMESPILEVMEALYEELFKEKPHVAACHAGLECGILGQNYPGLDMISFGPNILGAHSPDERASISSTQKFWNFLTEILKRTPEK